MSAAQRNKYRAQPTIVDGIRFHSKAEAEHYGDLKLLQRAGQSSGLELQPKFSLTINGQNCGSYYADFAYEEDGERVVIDVKGRDTPMSRLKRKLVKAIHNVDVRVVQA